MNINEAIHEAANDENHPSWDRTWSDSTPLPKVNITKTWMRMPSVSTDAPAHKLPFPTWTALGSTVGIYNRGGVPPVLFAARPFKATIGHAGKSKSGAHRFIPLVYVQCDGLTPDITVRVASKHVDPNTAIVAVRLIRDTANEKLREWLPAARTFLGLAGGENGPPSMTLSRAIRAQITAERVAQHLRVMTHHRSMAYMTDADYMYVGYHYRRESAAHDYQKRLLDLYERNPLALGAQHVEPEQAMRLFTAIPAQALGLLRGS